MHLGLKQKKKKKKRKEKKKDYRELFSLCESSSKKTRHWFQCMLSLDYLSTPWSMLTSLSSYKLQDLIHMCCQMAGGGKVKAPVEYGITKII